MRPRRLLVQERGGHLPVTQRLLDEVNCVLHAGEPRSLAILHLEDVFSGLPNWQVCLARVQQITQLFVIDLYEGQL